MNEYIIKKGDTMESISNSIPISPVELKAINTHIDFNNTLIADVGVNLPEPLKNKLDNDSQAPYWYRIAYDEMINGVAEIPGAQHHERILEYHSSTTLKATTDEVPWCSSFVNWCLLASGLGGTNSAAARSWLNWGIELSQPALGCVTVLSRGTNPSHGHVGFYSGYENGQIALLGGNQRDSVNISLYSADRVLGFLWP
ncbi:TIGR02594 family protein [Agarivorans sp. 1_MG-2023]|uniref:TIGR02594 family protein n=1 Tax=Agarivorans sp. 1_MG-2023 TaxID=3062634 RepID=UPI0026E4941A|nr:TIGR02594 family protein [Agarivorans sp. 1_MG-2023]MDO6762361.1 TIGR02594 family protein [Agarivorans sp. 1_MG-2023]